jgi:hypothetical protein
MAAPPPERRARSGQPSTTPGLSWEREGSRLQATKEEGVEQLPTSTIHKEAH